MANATGGTFTLTFNGQTTGPIPSARQRRHRGGARGAREHRRRRGHRHRHTYGQLPRRETPSRTSRYDGGRSGLTGTTPTLTVSDRHDDNGQGTNIPADGGLFNAPHVDARRSALNTNDLRGKVLQITVKVGRHLPGGGERAGGAYTVPAGTCFPTGTARTRPEIYAMGFRNPFRITIDKDDVRRQRLLARLEAPQISAGMPGTGPRRDRARARQLRLAAVL